MANREDAEATAVALTPYLESATGDLVAVHVIEKAGGVPDKASVEQRQLQVDLDNVLISSSKENAKALSAAGYADIDGTTQDTEAFELAGIDTARAVLTDAGEANVNTILTVRSIRPDIEIITLTDDSDQREILLETGADSVLSPHGVLGHRLAEKAIFSTGSELSGTIELGADFEVIEIPVQHGSELVNVRIRDTDHRERTGANIIGAWIDGELKLPPDPDALIRPNTVLLVSGAHESLMERVHSPTSNVPWRSTSRHRRLRGSRPGCPLGRRRGRHRGRYHRHSRP